MAANGQRRTASQESSESLEIENPGSNAPTGDIEVGTVYSSVVTLLATAMGAGILSLPRAFAMTGWALGVCLMLTIALAADVSLKFLVDCSRASGIQSYEGNAKYYLGSLGSHMTSFFLILLLFLADCAFVSIVKDLLPAFLNEWAGHETWYASSYVVDSLLCLVFVVPVCLFDNLTALQYASTLVIVCLAYFVIVLSAKFFFHAGGMEINETVVWANGDITEVLQGVNSIIPAFICHFNIFKIDSELKRECKSQIGSIIHMAIPFIGNFLYVFAALMGYWLCGNETPSNMLLAFPGDTYLSAARFTMALTNVLKIPLITQPLKDSVLQVLPTPLRKYGIPLTILLFPMILGSTYVLKRLDRVLGICGCTTGVSVCFVMPAMMRLELLKNPSRAHDPSLINGSSDARTVRSWTTTHQRSPCVIRSLAYFLIVGGVVAGAGGLFSIIWTWD